MRWQMNLVAWFIHLKELTHEKGVAQISDAVWAIGIFLIFLTFIIIPMSNWFVDQYRATVAATQAKRVQQAVNTYIKDNHDTIAATATATTRLYLVFLNLLAVVICLLDFHLRMVFQLHIKLVYSNQLQINLIQ